MEECLDSQLIKYLKIEKIKPLFDWDDDNK